jgi:hypothetical protein
MRPNKKIETIMTLLGCEQTDLHGLYKHPDFNFILDMSATDPNKILLRLKQIFSHAGYRKAQSDFRQILGIVN